MTWYRLDSHKRRSAVTRVKSKMAAVAAMNRSAGSLWGRSRDRLAVATSRVTGASRSGTRASWRSTQSDGEASSSIPPALGQQQRLPHADRRQPQLVGCVLQLLSHRLWQALGVEQAPKPDVGVEQEPQSPRTSQSLSSAAGDTMSPRMRPEPAADPSQPRSCDGWEGGTISAMGAPLRVTNTGRPVCRTSSSTARQVALNLDMAIDSTPTSYQDGRSWSEIMV